MIPILFPKDARTFTSNGIGRLSECVSCTVTEERNGIFECQFEYPITGKWFSELLNGGIIGVIHDNRHDIQPFDLYRRTAPINGIVTFYAHHISYRLGKITVQPFSATSCPLALARIKSNSMTGNPFTFWTDKSTAGDFSVKVPSAARALLSGQEGSILDVYGGGEYRFNLWAVNLYQSRGVDSGVTVRYGKNLADIQDEVDEGEIYNCVAPFWQGSDGEIVRGGLVLASGAPVPRFVWTTENDVDIETDGGEVIEFRTAILEVVPLDLSSKFEEAPTEAELRSAAAQYLDRNTPYLPRRNIKVDFVALAQTAEYADVSNLQRVELCDTVSVYYPELGVIQEQQKIIKVVYNVLLETYDELELGSPTQTLASAMTGDLPAQISDLSTMLRAVPTQTELEEAITDATNQITGGLGGYVVLSLNASGEPEELLIMDTPDKATAVNVWRWNRGGLGHSHNGYNGPFSDVAITQDGKINASMITVGTLTANLIKAGVISDTASVSSWDMTTGALITRNITISGGELELRVNANFGLNIGPYGDIAVGVKPPNLSSFSNNECPFQVNNQGQVKAIQIQTWGREYGASSGNYSLMGKVVGLKQASESLGPGVCIESPTGGKRAHFADAGNTFWWDTKIDSNLTVTGTKNREVATEDYGSRLLYCLESPSPVFSDFGEAEIGEDGVCYVWFDPIFSETVSLEQYQVHLTAYGEGALYVSARKAGCFVVSGTPGLSFGWAVTAKQKDFDQRRIDPPSIHGEKDGRDYGEESAVYIETLKGERIS